MKEWIGYFENILPDALSNNIMNIKNGWQTSGFSSHEGRLEDRDSKKRVDMKEIYIQQYMPFYNDLFEATLKVVNAYKKKHPYTKYMSSIRCTNFRVNKYI